MDWVLSNYPIFIPLGPLAAAIYSAAFAQYDRDQIATGDRRNQRFDSDRPDRCVRKCNMTDRQFVRNYTLIKILITSRHAFMGWSLRATGG